MTASSREASSGGIPTIKMNRVMLKHISVLGLNLHGYHERDPGPQTRATTRLFELFAEDRSRQVIHQKNPLGRAAEPLAELS